MPGKHRRRSRLRGVVVLAIALMMVAAASAYTETEDFNYDERTAMEGAGHTIFDFLTIDSWAPNGAVVVETDGSITAYNANNPNPNDTPNGCLDGGDGLGWDVNDRPAIEGNTWTFSFDDTVFVNSFSIDLFDYGDWFPSGVGSRTVTMTAFDSSDNPIGTPYTYSVAGTSAAYDACQGGVDGRETLSVSATDIAYVEVEFDGVDPGIAFDNMTIDFFCIKTFDLIADGGSAETAIDVGEVLVWDDGETLYVQYVTDVFDWRIASIALEVGSELSDIPQTKKGNPIPGKFSEKESFPYPWVTETPVYTFDLGDFDGTPIVAAHADLWDYASTDEVTFSSSDYGTDAVEGFGRFDSYTEDVSGETPVTISAVPKNPAWITGLSSAWITIAEGADPTIDQWFRIDHTIEVPGPVFGDGTIVANSDNAETVLNGDFVSGWNGDVETVPVPDSERGAFVTDSTYTFPATTGSNTVEFLVRNYTPPNPENPGDNPMALIYEGSVSYHDRSETGWGDGTDFPGNNWGTYIEYTVGYCFGS